jgi:hypothetical protein
MMNLRAIFRTALLALAAGDALEQPSNSGGRMVMVDLDDFRNDFRVDASAMFVSMMALWTWVV